MIGWWSGLSPWVRYGLAIFFLLLSTVMFFAFDWFWPWGWGVGAVLLLVAGRSAAEKKGYRS
jgi:hypothetical protein